MRTSDEILAEIARLKHELSVVEWEFEKESRRAIESIPIVWDYKIKWQSTYIFFAERLYSQATVDAIKAWEAKYNRAYMKQNSGGMVYALVGNLLFAVSDGTYIIKRPKGGDPFSYEPMEISDADAAELRAGRMPEALRMN